MVEYNSSQISDWNLKQHSLPQRSAWSTELTKLQKVDYRSVQMKNFCACEVSHGRVRFSLSFGRNLKIIISTSSTCFIHRELPTLQKAEYRCVQILLK